MKKIELTRDSVALGDDFNAPHSIKLEINRKSRIIDVLNHIISVNYLPKIADGKATWSVSINNPIAVITQENPKFPLLICHPDYPHQETKGFVDIKHIHFNYHAQKDAKEVFEVLLRFRVKP